MAKTKRQCLIIEKHPWETGAHQHQLQIPLAGAASFFGPQNTDLDINIRVFVPANVSTHAFVRQVTISRLYAKSATRRLNRYHSLGAASSCFIFFEQTDQPNVFDFWSVEDKAIVAAHYGDWLQAHHGSSTRRGRLYKIVPAPAPRVWHSV